MQSTSWIVVKKFVISAPNNDGDNADSLHLLYRVLFMGVLLELIHSTPQPL